MNTQKEIDALAIQEAALVRREAQKADRELWQNLCKEYDQLGSNGARKAFREKNAAALKCVPGLLGVCLTAGRPFTQRARQELYAMPMRQIKGMKRNVFSRLSDLDKMRYINNGGKVID
jgi:hypothetical protein